MADEREIRTIKTAYDVATLFRAIPWIFMSGDQRGPQVLTQVALADVRSFIESYVADPTRDRRALMRGLALTWFQVLGLNVDPNAVEAVIGLISQQVDEFIDAEMDPELEGERA